MVITIGVSGAEGAALQLAGFGGEEVRALQGGRRRVFYRLRYLPRDAIADDLGRFWATIETLQCDYATLRVRPRKRELLRGLRDFHGKKLRSRRNATQL